MDGKSLTIKENSQKCEENGTASPTTGINDSAKNATETNNGSNDMNTSASGVGATDVILPDSILDTLYHSYSIKQRRVGLIWFLVASILFDIWCIAIPQGHCWKSIGFFGINVVLNAVLLLVLHLTFSFGDDKNKQSNLVWEIAPYFSLFLAILQFILYLYTKNIATPRDVLGWAILLVFLIYVTFPVPLVYTGVLMVNGFFVIYLSCLIGFTSRDPLFVEQVFANTILVAASGAIGILYYFLGEAKQKRAFLETKKSLEVKMIIEEQSAEQERLLLSVLPEHVAVKMRQDLGSTNSEQFKKIYMSRHENVSILYADIVGFTAISSTYSAQDLVKMLNELFARFDRLAEKYQQLRIKILGDCYYCISGAPVERPDHAVLCVHMGLSMVKAIKYVQQKTNSPVDMRVGIHTGAILAGILGQRQWQFDVYSKDVELANKMESSGKAGFVHISEKTLNFLSGEFEVEPALGEKREEALRIAGLKTYFITKVLKPFVPPNQQKKNGTTSDTDNDHRDSNASNTTKQSDSQANENDINSTEIVPDEESKATSDDAQEKQEDFKQRLRKELVARDGHGNLSKDTTILLTFKDKKLEEQYIAQREPYSSIPLIASLLVQFIDSIYSVFVLPRICIHFFIVAAPLPLVFLLVWVSVAENLPQIFPNFIVKISKKFNDINILRRTAAILIVLILGITNLIDMFTFSNYHSIKTEDVDFNSNYSNIILNNSNYSIFLSNDKRVLDNRTIMSIMNETIENDDNLSTRYLIYPSYLSNYSILILIAIAVITQLTHWLKIFFMILFTVLHCVANIFLLDSEYSFEDYFVSYKGLPIKFTASTILFVVALSLSFLARHMDKEDRVIFKWKTEVAEQKEKVSDMRRRNEALVYNVLPVHVAEHFMKNRKRSHDDLYSQSYAEVGVLFASMPNFTDFYSEETVNNQGLECLRFLNEVISDYDALLELPQFQDIIKIKTIGSTYMAASGLNPSRQVKPDDPTIVRWAHLALLVDFALELKKALTGINEQSFNHFVLKMGINNGPITAGVIGARKPHYDIWGNTVNVASRMESTGKAGAIQVTEETTVILKQFGYTFEQRGLVVVKGKGQLMTYYLLGKEAKWPPDIQPVKSPLHDVTVINENINHDLNSKNDSKEPKKILGLKLDPIEDTNIVKSESDPRSPKSIHSPINENFCRTLMDKSQCNNNESELDNRCEDKTQNNNLGNIHLVEVADVKTPLLDLNSTNLETNLEFVNNDNEKDSLIVKK